MSACGDANFLYGGCRHYLLKTHRAFEWACQCNTSFGMSMKAMTGFTWLILEMTQEFFNINPIKSEPQFYGSTLRHLPKQN